MIPYGGREIINAKESVLSEYEITKDQYALIIARAEPENSILEIVSAFSSKKRGLKLIILGDYHPDINAYHRAIFEAASDEVVFIGSVYDEVKVSALRYFARVYLHGHQVGGTNPSLVEALGAGNAVIAHDNKFNRWVAKDAAIYFEGVQTASKALDKVFKDSDQVERLRKRSRENFNKNFRWNHILQEYERFLLE